MRFEIENGTYLGSAEWAAPGEVILDMAESPQKQWLRDYFSGEAVYLAGCVDCPEMVAERRDSSERAFVTAAQELPAWSYRVRTVETGGVPSAAAADGGP